MEKSKLIIAGLIHELGHTMGLLVDDYGGIDNIESDNFFSLQFYKYRDYKSVMNYRYVFKDSIKAYSDGSNGQEDFDDWKNLDFSFFKNTHFE